VAENSPLAHAFSTEVAGGESSSPRPEVVASLEAAIANALVRARAVFPTLKVEDAAFARHLARASGGADPVGLQALVAPDLYLACACAEQVDGAVAIFRARYDTAIRGSIARVVQGADLTEVEQQFLDATLVGTVHTPAKIRSYAGRAPLERWLSVSAQRTALMWLREGRAETRARDGAAAESDFDSPAHPELAYLKERYRGDFALALKDALERAPERERALLRLHVVSGVSVEKIGKMYGVSQPTASRWLAAAREGLLDRIKETLGTRLGVSADELASIADLVASRLDLSLSMLLRPR
jgi:RNA polymerase sigma-70 factor (ECF subfamily)